MFYFALLHRTKIVKVHSRPKSSREKGIFCNRAVRIVSANITCHPENCLYTWQSDRWKLPRGLADVYRYSAIRHIRKRIKEFKRQRHPTMESKLLRRGLPICRKLPNCSAKSQTYTLLFLIGLVKQPWRSSLGIFKRKILTCSSFVSQN